ncbi:hypothetical protein [Coleofasciculus sp.]|jgi:hypothetical protein|uniref:hypothetical protein n=1 Tax=Coleofasciculus sp. TaxID=3100458 RepID=UPI003A2E8B04
MAEIKINNLKADAEKSEEMIDLRSEAEAGNSNAFTAFTTLRGGMMLASLPKTVWSSFA